VKRLIFGLLCTVLIVTVVALQFDSQVHQFEGRCLDCHIGLGNPNLLHRDPDLLCLECHDDQDERSHPSNFFLTQQVPERFPLYQGKMTCVSCHFPHQSVVLANGEEKRYPAGPFLLRFEQAGKMFCFQCHRTSFTSSKTDSHAIAYRRAHIEKQTGLMEALDDHSTECLSCHDGTLSTAANNGRGASWDHGQTIGVSHPIAVSYRDAYDRKPTKYRDPSLLDSRIKLFNGKLGCESCHVPFGDEHDMLVMSNIRSRLCLACHTI